jgi:hypothetical protein
MAMAIEIKKSERKQRRSEEGSGDFMARIGV